MNKCHKKYIGWFTWHIYYVEGPVWFIKLDSLLFHSLLSCKFHSDHILCSKGIFILCAWLSSVIWLAPKHARLPKIRHRENALKCYLSLPLEPSTLGEGLGPQLQIRKSKAILSALSLSCKLRRKFKRFKMMALSQSKLNPAICWSFTCLVLHLS